jgi:hypothetical protein
MSDIYEPLRFFFITEASEIYEATHEKATPASGMSEVNILRRGRRCC